MVWNICWDEKILIVASPLIGWLWRVWGDARRVDIDSSTTWADRTMNNVHDKTSLGFLDSWTGDEGVEWFSLETRICATWGDYALPSGIIGGATTLTAVGFTGVGHRTRRDTEEWCIYYVCKGKMTREVHMHWHRMLRMEEVFSQDKEQCGEAEE